MIWAGLVLEKADVNYIELCIFLLATSRRDSCTQISIGTAQRAVVRATVKETTLHRFYITCHLHLFLRRPARGTLRFAGDPSQFEGNCLRVLYISQAKKLYGTRHISRNNSRLKDEFSTFFFGSVLSFLSFFLRVRSSCERIAATALWIFVNILAIHCS